MRMSSRPLLCGLATAVVLAWSTAGAIAGDRWYPLDDDYYDPPAYYPLPPPPPPVYRVPPPAVYVPPVYGWSDALPPLPPAPSSCGKYRYWNGERCADARYEPPYVGPRW